MPDDDRHPGDANPYGVRRDRAPRDSRNPYGSRGSDDLIEAGRAWLRSPEAKETARKVGVAINKTGAAAARAQGKWRFHAEQAAEEARARRAGRAGTAEPQAPAVPAVEPIVVSDGSVVKPRTVEAAEREGYDPEVANATRGDRFVAFGLDLLLYNVLFGAAMLGANYFINPDTFEALLGGVFLLGAPAGFYLYRAVGDAVFEGSPGKRLRGLTMTGPNGMPVSGGDGLRRNLWLLPSVIPVAGHLVTAILGLIIFIAAGKEPLGRGFNDRATRLRVQRGVSERIARGKRYRAIRRIEQRTARKGSRKRGNRQITQQAPAPRLGLDDVAVDRKTRAHHRDRGLR